MNVISPQPADSLERQRQRCEEMADMALQLARAVFQKSLADWSGATAGQTPSTSTALLFLRLAAFAKQTTQLEARLAGTLAAPRAPRESAPAKSRAAPPPDPRREPLRAALDYTTEHLPNRATIRRETHAIGDQKLATEPEAEIGTLFDTVCKELSIHIDYAKMPDDILETLMPADFQPPTSTELPPGWQELDPNERKRNEKKSDAAA